MTATTTADRIAAAGLDAGKAVWAAIEATCEGRCLPWVSARKLFDCMMETLSDDIDSDERYLFDASAYEAIPDIRLTASERSEISSNAWDAYDAFVEARKIADRIDAAEYCAEAARDERMMAGAK
jgi:hypothetical protein